MHIMSVEARTRSRGCSSIGRADLSSSERALFGCDVSFSVTHSDARSGPAVAPGWRHALGKGW